MHWNNEGNLTYTGSAPSDYSTSIVGNRTVSFITAAASATPFKPFLVVAATRAPHGPQTPAPWYADALPEARNLRTPAWNYSGREGGHVPWVADLPPLSTGEAVTMDKEFRDRWRSLLSVDDLVVGVVQALEGVGLLNRTYVIHTRCDDDDDVLSPPPRLTHDHALIRANAVASAQL